MVSPGFGCWVEPESMDVVVPASDETEPGRYLPSHVYSKEIRARAIELFKRGAGYKRTSSALGIKSSVVRDWAQRWRKELFTADIRLNLYRYNDEPMKRGSALYRKGCRDIGELSEHTGVPSGVCRRIVARCEREDVVERSKEAKDVEIDLAIL